MTSSTRVSRPARPTFSPPRVVIALLAMLLGPACTTRAMVGDAAYVTFAAAPGSLPLVEGTTAALLLVDDQDWPGVVRAATDLQADIERVTSRKPALAHAASGPVRTAVLVGTIGRSRVIDELVRSGKLRVEGVRGAWESWVRETVDQPLPGIDRAVVIAGSDKRGTIFGVYDLSQQIGVSPWYWWADVVPEHHDALHVAAGRFVQGPPSVKYRGIFLNDEAPDLTNWIIAKFGYAPPRQDPPVPKGVPNYGHEFYARIFEVLLRLRANYLWPAMWSNAFNEDDPANAALADEYGIVMGTSHQEPMLRAQKEWDRRYAKAIGPWNYARHPRVLEEFWREGIRRNRPFESIVTMGLRGANDTEMAPGGPETNRALLEQIVDAQRLILREEMHRDVREVPQLWCLYKEVQDYYEAGMRVPDDVTLLWAEDNWGNVRRLPTREERTRSGGAGIYYHFDYHGGPRSYQWLNTSPLPKIWEQMSLAKQYGADRIWIVNVGHFKGYEVPTEFFLSLGWDTGRWSAATVNAFFAEWAAREFGRASAGEIARIVAGYAKFNGRRKPEMLAPDTYSLVDYGEAERVVDEFKALEARASRVFAQLPEHKRDAFYQLVLFPTKASALVNELYVTAGRNALYAQQGRASTTAYAIETRRLFQTDLQLMHFFNHGFAEGRWAHFMDQAHLGYTTWRDPPANTLDAITLAEPTVPAGSSLGVAVEGSRSSWPGPADATAPALPRFDSLNDQRSWIEVFNRASTPFDFSVRTSAAWVRVGATSDAADASGTLAGTVANDRRVWVSIDWTQAPAGDASATVTVTGAGTSVAVRVDAHHERSVTRATLNGFAEAAGYLSIEPEHFTRRCDAPAGRWTVIADYGRTLSGVRADAPAHAPSATPGRDAPVLEYRIYVYQPGTAKVVAVTSPTLNFVPDRALRYAVSFDDEPPQVVTLVPAGYRAQNANKDWEDTVGDNARHSTSTHLLAQPGYHTLKIWMVDPAVVLQKVMIDLGGLRPSYLGPPETFGHATQ